MTLELTVAPERKSAPDVDMHDAFDEFMRTFDSFKADNDRRLKEVEKKNGADVVTVEKVDRISKALDEQKRAITSESAIALYGIS